MGILLLCSQVVMGWGRGCLGNVCRKSLANLPWKEWREERKLVVIVTDCLGTALPLPMTLP